MNTFACGLVPVSVKSRSDDGYWNNLEHHYADPAIEIASRICEPDSIILDIGANIGVTALGFSLIAPRGKVYGFEPVPRTYGYLTENIRHNRRSNVTILNAGCGAQVATMTMHDDTYSAGSFIVQENTFAKNVNAVKVEIIPVDKFVSDNKINRIDFIKIDVEGFEMDVLDGMARTLEIYKPIVYMELNSWCLIANARVFPTDFLERVWKMFHAVGVVNDSGVQWLKSFSDVRGAIHDNLVKHGCVDNILCVPSKEAMKKIMEKTKDIGLNSSPTFIHAYDDGGAALDFRHPFIGSGWSGIESFGRWSKEKEAGLVVNVGMVETPEVELCLEAEAFLPFPDAKMHIDVLVNGKEVGQWVYTVQNNTEPKRLRIPSSVATGRLNIVLRIRDPFQPSELGLSGDTRHLGIAARKMILKAV